VFCPVSKQPELKHAAARLEPVKSAWQCAAFVLVPIAQLDAVRLELLAHFQTVTGGFAVPIEGQVCGVWVEAVAETTPDAAWMDTLDTLLGTASEHTLALNDTSVASGRRVWVRGDILTAARLSGPTISNEAAQWLRDLMLQQTPVRPLSKWLLAPTPPKDDARTTSHVVCTCFGIRKREIEACASDAVEEVLSHVQKTLKCGTNCGSCLPELKRLVAKVPAKKETV
jgi:assimilatory nitrate reductase catalytic subunit